MLDWIIVDVIETSGKSRVVANGVFPESALPALGMGFAALYPSYERRALPTSIKFYSTERI